MQQPICPHCSSPIHKGANDQCPVCGYSMHRADGVFGANEVEFTRVVDAAGALTHRERMSLIRSLESLERNLPPIALCVYITDHGQASDFRHHAHWILNHARIHHPSFGKRERRKAVEDAEITELKPGERRPRPEPNDEPWWARWFWTPLRDRLWPVPPPAQPEWMLILVLDVQLEIACFSWGYMLDPYINPDTINTGIVKARLLFRERALVSALKKVMKITVGKLVSNSRKVNKTLKNSYHYNHRNLTRILTAAAGISLLGSTPEATAAPEFTDDDYAEVVELPTTPAPPATPQNDDTAEAVTPTPAPQPAPAINPGGNRGAAASYKEAPRWTSHDYEQLMLRTIDAGLNMLIPGAKEVTPTPLPKLKKETGAFEESDTEVKGRYTEEYRPRPGRRVPDLNDPQYILTDVERNDARYRLEQLNAHCPFRICVAIFKAGQSVPQGLTAPTLVHAVTDVDEYAVLIQYGMGEEAVIDIGYKSIKLTDEQRHKFLLEVQQKVQAAGGGIEGLLAAMECVKGQIMPLASNFPPLSAGTGYKLTKTTLPGQEDEKKKDEELTGLKKIHAQIMSPEFQPYLIIAGLALLPIGLLILIIWLVRHKSELLETPPDYRLESRYGAGVSRHVRYLEGQEAAKPKTIF